MKAEELFNAYKSGVEASGFLPGGIEDTWDKLEDCDRAGWESVAAYLTAPPDTGDREAGTTGALSLTPDAPPDRFRPAKVEIDMVFDEPIPCYVIDNERWNGSMLPFFAKAEADEILKTWNRYARQDDVKEAYYDAGADVYFFFTSEDPNDEPDGYSGGDVTINGQTLRLYPIGAWSWTWTEAVDEEEEPGTPASAPGPVTD